jgi:peroxiredoxin
MRKKILFVAAGVLAGSVAAWAAAQAVVGESAPSFTATDSNGKPESLADFKGKWVVLEWTNNECPFVKKHYGSGNMQKLQKLFTGKGVTWLSVVSSAPGQQGFVDGAKANALTRERGAAPSAVLLDPQGTLGRLYGAKTTPHMYVIDPQGKLVYNGAIDDKPSTDPSDVSGAKNYVSAALEQAMAGKAVAVASSAPYGCAVKYAN